MLDPDQSAVTLRGSLHQNLARMRCFARTLTGTQTRADLCVVQLMEDLLLAPRLFDLELDPRVALYRRLLDLLSIECDRDEPSYAMQVTPRSRQAQLLVAIEEFTSNETAIILNVGTNELNKLLAAAEIDFDRQRGARIMIIEDEAFVALELEFLITDLGHEWLDTAATSSEAIDKAARLKPDLILSDVQLADGSSGIDATEEIQKLNDTPVIFITGNPDLLLTGRRPEPAFLIEKPFKKTVVEAMINQALFLQEQSPQLHQEYV